MFHDQTPTPTPTPTQEVSSLLPFLLFKGEEVIFLYLIGWKKWIVDGFAYDIVLTISLVFLCSNFGTKGFLFDIPK